MSNHQQPSSTKRTILYYPTISIPTRDWLRQSLLYWDEIGSIVPMDYENRTLIPYSPDIQYLKAEGEFRPFRPGKLTANWGAVNNLVRELMDIMTSPRFQSILPPPEMRVLNSSIHKDKVSKEVLDFLTKEGLARWDRYDREWFKFESNTALLYMALLAKYLADEDSMSTVPGTDRQEYETLIFQATSPTEGVACLSTSFHSILPVPREDIPLSDIVEFKRRRRQELLKFRQQICEFQANLRACQDKSDIKDVVVTFSEKITKEVNDLKEVLDDSKLASVLGSLKTIIKLDSPALWATAGVIAGQATQVADIPIEWSAVGIGLLGAIEVATFLVDRRNERRATLRDSPFAYLYYAEHEQIVR